MIKANELRIGNAIRYTQSADLRDKLRGTILTVDSDTIAYLAKGDRPDFYEPISLTPETLEKCGFVKVLFGSNHWCIPSNNPSKSFEVLVWSDHVSYTLSNSFHLKLNYLHQLQNLYFINTGEEIDYQN
jgi:hypothetical protein